MCGFFLGKEKGGGHPNPDVEGSCPCCAGLSQGSQIPIGVKSHMLGLGTPHMHGHKESYTDLNLKILTSEWDSNPRPHDY